MDADTKKFLSLGSLAILVALVILVALRGGGIRVPLPFVDQEITITIPGPAARVDPPQTESVESVAEVEKERPRPQRPVRRTPTSREPTNYILNGREGRFEATGTFAEVGMPGLTPGTNMEVSIYVPRWNDAPEVHMSFPRQRIDSTGIFKAQLPRYIRDRETGNVIDLSTRRYRFTFRVNDPQVRGCGSSRYANMIEGRETFWFLSARRVFCGNTDPVPDIEQYQVESAL